MGLVLNGGHLLCCLPLELDHAIVLSTIAPWIEILSLVSYEDVQKYMRLGSLAARGTGDVNAIQVCCLSVFLYVLGASAMTFQTFRHFDIAADRPRNQGGRHVVIAVEDDEETDELRTISASDETED